MARIEQSDFEPYEVDGALPRFPPRRNRAPQHDLLDDVWIGCVLWGGGRATHWDIMFMTIGLAVGGRPLAGVWSFPR